MQSSKYPFIVRFICMFLCLTLCAAAYAQTGEISGKVTDKANAMPIKNVKVSVLDQSGNETEVSCLSDKDGNYALTKVTEGNYVVKYSIKGFSPMIIHGMIVNANKTTFQNIELSRYNLPPVEVVSH